MSKTCFRFALTAVCLTVLLSPLSAVTTLTKPTPVTLQDTARVAVKGGSIVLKVIDYGEARARIMRLAVARGAALRDEQSQVNLPGQRYGNLTLEMDAAQLTPLMEEVRRIGKLYSERAQTSDMTSQYQMLDKRVSLLNQNEGDLLNFLHSPRRMRGSDILFVQYRLYQSRVEAANALQERSDMARRAQKASLDVMLFEPEPRKTFDWGVWRAAASYRAKGSFLYITRKAVTGLFYVAYFSPFWVPCVLVVFFGGRKLIRSIRRRINDWSAGHDTAVAPQTESSDR